MIVSDPKNCALARQEIAALAMVNARRARARTGAPQVAVIEAVEPLERRLAMDDADAVLTALREAGCAV